MGHDEEEEEGLDIDEGLWTGVESGEGGAATARGWPAYVEVMAAPSCSGCGAVTEDVQTVEESGAVAQPDASRSARALGGESRKTIK